MNDGESQKYHRDYDRPSSSRRPGIGSAESKTALSGFHTVQSQDKYPLLESGSGGGSLARSNLSRRKRKESASLDHRGYVDHDYTSPATSSAHLPSSIPTGSHSEIFTRPRRTFSDLRAESDYYWEKYLVQMNKQQHDPFASYDEYVPQWEFSLQYSRDVPDPVDGSALRSVYRDLDSSQKAWVIEYIHQRRPYTSPYLRTQMCEGRMTPFLAQEMLCGEEDRMDAATEKMFPDTGKKHKKFVPWMRGLSTRDRIQVVDKLARSTLQAADKLRDHMILSRMESSTAHLILDATTPSEVRDVAYAHQLYVPSEVIEGEAVEDGQKEESRIWMKGMSEIQKRALIQRMVASGVSAPKRCYEILKRRNKIREGYGLFMLRIRDHDDFLDVLAWLKGHPGQPNWGTRSSAD
ncbi:hypothetical protein CBS101457_000154 [Exobasidium rhododendri]|nr:hypothetical protein CBS101457_000154 [Exobasidium rhododendri]